MGSVFGKQGGVAGLSKPAYPAIHAISVEFYGNEREARVCLLDGARHRTRCGFIGRSEDCDRTAFTARAIHLPNSPPFPLGRTPGLPPARPRDQTLHDYR